MASQRTDDLPSWAEAGSTLGDEFSMPRRYTVMTASGHKVLSEATPTHNTYEKDIGSLMYRLQPQHRRVLIQFCVKLEQSRLSKFKSVLRSLSDGQFEVLVQAFDYASLPRFERYLEICATRFEGLINTPEVTYCRSFLAAFNETSTGSSNYTPIKTSDRADVGMPGIHVRPLSNSSVPALSRYVHDVEHDVLVTLFEQFAKAAFVPGYIFPDQTPNENGEHLFQGRTYHNPSVPAFLALDRALYAEFSRAYWEDTTWVIGTGPYELTVGFLSRMEDQGARIRSAYLTFTIEDLPDATDLLSWTQASILFESGGSELNNIEVLERYASSCEACCDELLRIWKQKFHYIAWLDLEELTLDLTNAYGPDGDFLPHLQWIMSLSAFGYRFPPSFTILAPSQAIHEETEMGFLALNLG